MRFFHYFLLLFFVVGYSFGQINTDSGYLEQLNISEDEELTYFEVIEAAEAYFSNKNTNVRGSGYKPFKRWEYHWKQYEKPDGTLQTPKEFWDIWRAKNARKLEKSTLVDQSNWVSVGPIAHVNTGSWSSGQGRTNTIMVDPNNPNIYYVGAPAGGIWKSTDAGLTWNSLSDFLPQIGVSAIAIDPTDSDVIYIGTGDDDAGDSYSVGLLKSTDGGLTWNTTGLSFNSVNARISDVYLDPNDNNTIFVASNSGLYKSTNAGTSFNLMFTGNVKDLKLRPGSSDTLFIATPNQIHRSFNGGLSFTQLSGMPANAGRIVLAVTPANPNFVYALVASTGNWSFEGLFRSTNNGNFFSRMDDGTDIFESPQAWFDLALAVSPTDPNELYTGCLNVWKSTNGGQTYTKLNSWSNPSGAAYTHADIHQLRFLNNQLFCASDGGIYRSTDGGSTFTDLTAELVVSQFYKIAVAKQNSNQMVGGLQDNGGHAYSQNQWKNYYGADGMDTAIDPNNPNNMYGFIQFGGALYFSGSGGNSRDSQVQGPEQGNWVTPLVSNSQGELFAGYSRLYKLVNNSWQPLAGPFSNNINNIAVAPSDDNIIYFSVGNQLYRSANAGNSGALMSTTSSSITSIDVHKDFPNTIYITTSGSGGGVFTSTNGGLTLANITGNLPNLGKNVIKHQGNHPDNPLFVGTTLGVWRKDDTQSLWEVFENNLPNVSVRDLEINLNDGNITAATYGRGIWQSDIPVVLPPSDVRLMQIATQQNGNLCGGFDQSIIVKNNGQNIINSVDVTYTINGLSNSFTWTGSIASEATQSIDFQISGVPRGNYDMEVEVDTPGDAFSDNNSLIAPVTLNDFGVAQQVNTFETPQDELITIDINGGLPAGNLWQRGVPSGSVLNTTSSGVNAYATNLIGQYPNNTTSELITQCYDLTTIGNPILQFEMAFQIENNWDVLYMMYSTNDGQTWNVLGSATDPNWYNSNLVGSQGQCPLCVGAQWTGSATTMTTYSLDLGFLSNENSVIFKYVFRSDFTVTQEGAVIDDFVILGNTLGVNDFNAADVSVFPNPSTGVFNITWSLSESIDLEVYDMTGKRIWSAQNLNDGNFTMNLNGLSQGMYLLKINAESQKAVTKKLVLY